MPPAEEQFPEQHCTSPIQVLPSLLQAAAWHMPPEQFPEQQSPGAEQVPPLAVQPGGHAGATDAVLAGPQQTPPSQQA